MAVAHRTIKIQAAKYQFNGTKLKHLLFYYRHLLANIHLSKWLFCAVARAVTPAEQ